MLDANDLVKSIQKAAVAAVQASKPAEITHGTILSVDPLKIQVDQKTVLGQMQLDRGESMQEYEAEIELEIEELELDLELEIEGESAAAKAKGEGKMKGMIRIRRGLDVGSEVILMRQQGGQKYVMYDKVKKDVT
ncbi:MAG: DUF2577 family protein [Eubacteriales bacterium]|nr:DUF2577 family protein [Eubacteriales bacterium]